MRALPPRSERLFVVIQSNARAKPSSRWMNHEPPESGIRPMPMKPGTNVAASLAIRRSQAAASDEPRARARAVDGGDDGLLERRG